jgi:hypothetical protein
LARPTVWITSSMTLVFEVEAGSRLCDDAGKTTR